MRISDVLELLRADFPTVSHSKLRFLEDQGLIDPQRTPAGYRQYSPADVERLRFVLTEQRDRYLPLKVIRGKLDDLDRAHPATPTPPSPPDPDPDPVSARGDGVDQALADDLVDAGVIRRGPGGGLDPWAIQIVQVAAELAPYGIEPRHLRSLRTASDRHVSLIEQVVAPWAHQSSPSARAHAGDVASRVADLCARAHTVFVAQGIADLTG